MSWPQHAKLWRAHAPGDPINSRASNDQINNWASNDQINSRWVFEPRYLFDFPEERDEAGGEFRHITPLGVRWLQLADSINISPRWGDLTEAR
jgi:hypothetical protein